MFIQCQSKSSHPAHGHTVGGRGFVCQGREGGVVPWGWLILSVLAIVGVLSVATVGTADARETFVYSSSYRIAVRPNTVHQGGDIHMVCPKGKHLVRFTSPGPRYVDQIWYWSNDKGVTFTVVNHDDEVTVLKTTLRCR